MPYVCYDCKLGYGHPLIWCSGCGRKMIKVKDVDWTKLKDDNWKLEGNDIHEYYMYGQLIPSNSRYKTLANEIKKLYPDIWKLFDIPENYNAQYDPTPQAINWQHWDRSIKMYLKTDMITVTFNKPEIIFRLKGSNLPIDGIDIEQPFKYKDNGG